MTGSSEVGTGSWYVYLMSTVSFNSIGKVGAIIILALQMREVGDKPKVRQVARDGASI